MSLLNNLRLDDQSFAYIMMHENFEDLQVNEIYPVSKYNSTNRTISVTFNYKTYKIDASVVKFRSLTSLETILYREEIVILRTHRTESLDSKHRCKLYAGDKHYVAGFDVLESAYTIIDGIKYELADGYYEHHETFNNIFNITQLYYDHNLPLF